MGYGVADLRAFARTLLKKDGVSGVWLLSDLDERNCTMIVAVKGFDHAAEQKRLDIRDDIESYLYRYGEDMRNNAFVFDYRLTVDEPEVGPLHIPLGAEQVAV